MSAKDADVVHPNSDIAIDGAELSSQKFWFFRLMSTAFEANQRPPVELVV
jgi:hypothetical protein